MSEQQDVEDDGVDREGDAADDAELAELPDEVPESSDKSRMSGSIRNRGILRPARLAHRAEGTAPGAGEPIRARCRPGAAGFA